jgi:arginyl-tRNA synthetase
MKRYLTEIIGNAMKALPYEHSLPLVFEKPKNEQHGDLTTNIAMLLAKLVKKNPRLVAQEIIEKAHIDPRAIVAVDIAGPGFINFKFADTFFTNQVSEILRNSESYGKSSLGGGKKTQVEFVSANPTGPLSVGHGRQAAIGDTISNLLQWTGYNVTREYY